MTENHMCRNTRSWLRRALRVAAPVALVVSLAAPAMAARIVQVRVGNHPTFSRVVFELDSHAGYQIESRGAAGSKVLALTIDASSRDRDVISKSLGIGSVSVEAVDGKSLALVTLRRDDLMVKEMILSNPPRIVLDFEYAAPVAEFASASSGASAPVDDAPAPVTVEPVVEEPVQVEPEPNRPEPVVVTPLAVAEPEPIDEPIDHEAAEKAVQISEIAAAFGTLDDSRNAPARTEFVAGTNGATLSMDPAISDSTPQQSSSNRVLPLAATIVGVLLIAGVVMMSRRRGSVPNGSAVTARPAELAEGGAEAIVQVSEANTAAYSLSEVSATSHEPGTEIFDEDSEGEKTMDMEATDLPAERGEFAASQAVATASGDAASSDLSSIVQELMTRLGTLETRLEESSEAREQLERQVAAQSEELRVQRAAIARTQRALRSLSRTDEDQATEPALRNPSV
ncbi:MAG: hypothetical protein VCE43_00600 [Myxococcota bacterium]